MFAAGLIDEVRSLMAAGYGPQAPGMRGIGYQEFFLMQAGCLSWGSLRELVKRNSRRYAKRQLTFFRAIPQVSWFSPGDVEGIRKKIAEFLAESSH